MKTKVTYISESGKSAILMTEQTIGPIVQVLSGFVRLPEGHNVTVGQELVIPAKKVTKEVRTTEDGKSFDFLIFEA